jgi:hypothetical protein
MSLTMATLHRHDLYTTSFLVPLKFPILFWTWLSRKIIRIVNEWNNVTTLGTLPLMASSGPGTSPSHTASRGSEWRILGSG